MPRTTYSLHYLAHPGLAEAVENFLEREREMVARGNEMLSEAAPFRRGDGGGQTSGA